MKTPKQVLIAFAALLFLLFVFACLLAMCFPNLNEQLVRVAKQEASGPQSPARPKSMVQGPKSTAEGFMDAVLKNEDVSRYCGDGFKGTEITDYVVSAYTIEKVTGDIVSVKITFRSGRDLDVNETRKFRVKNGKIVSVE